MRPSARSSLDAVLAHRSELQLDDVQVARLSGLDDERERKASALRAELLERSPGRNPRADGPDASPTAAGAQAPGPTGIEPPSGMGRLGGRGRGGERGQLGPMPDETRDERLRLLERLDDLDTQAFLSADGVFTDAQRARAQAIASKYREALFDFRAAMKARRQPAD